MLAVDSLATNNEQVRRRRLLILAVVSGSLAGLFLLLFAMANTTWVVIRLPTAPWTALPPVPVFETQSWALIFVCFAVGLCLGLVLAVRARRRQRELLERLHRLKAELEEARHLLATSHAKR